MNKVDVFGATSTTDEVLIRRESAGSTNPRYRRFSGSRASRRRERSQRMVQTSSVPRAI